MRWYNDAIEVVHMSEQVIEIRLTMPIGEVSDEHKAQAERYARQAYVLSLLRQGDVSAGRAAELLGINRWQLADLMSAHGISPFDETITREDLEREVAETNVALENPTSDSRF
jgi:predicted HTH domain antitoxin